jgi:hypothetical protein
MPSPHPRPWRCGVSPRARFAAARAAHRRPDHPRVFINPYQMGACAESPPSKSGKLCPTLAISHSFLITSHSFLAVSHSLLALSHRFSRPVPPTPPSGPVQTSLHSPSLLPSRPLEPAFLLSIARSVPPLPCNHQLHVPHGLTPESPSLDSKVRPRLYPKLSPFIADYPQLPTPPLRHSATSPLCHSTTCTPHCTLQLRLLVNARWRNQPPGPVGRPGSISITTEPAPARPLEAPARCGAPTLQESA